MTDSLTRAVVAALAVLVAAVLVLLEAVSGAEWQVVMQWLIAAYMAGEVVPPITKTVQVYAGRKS